jgi:GNAT superfamily N-acetyltransferase
MTDPPPDARRAADRDVSGMVETLVSAFDDDPLWSAAYADSTARPRVIRALWTPRVRNAVAAQSAWVAGGTAAVAVWFPPGVPALDHEEEEREPGLIRDLLGAGAAAVLELHHRLDAATPPGDFYYLDLLGVRSDRRGHGLGMALLRTSLAMVDDVGAAAYLESSNPANDRRYERLGFRPHGSFAGLNGGTVTTMWRPAGSVGPARSD